MSKPCLILHRKSANRPEVKEAVRALKAKVDAAEKKAAARLESAKAEAEARIQAVHEQAASKTGDLKAKLEARAAAVKKEHDWRSQKLGEAWDAIKAVLTP